MNVFSLRHEQNVQNIFNFVYCLFFDKFRDKIRASVFFGTLFMSFVKLRNYRSPKKKTNLGKIVFANQSYFRLTVKTLC